MYYVLDYCTTVVVQYHNVKNVRETRNIYVGKLLHGAKSRPISKDKTIIKIEHESNSDTSTYSKKFMFSYMQWIEYLTLATFKYTSNLVGMSV